MDFTFLVLAELNPINVHEDVVKIELERIWLFVRSHNKRIAEENDRPEEKHHPYCTTTSVLILYLFH